MYLLLANPEAGSKRFIKIKSQLLTLLGQLGVKFELVELPNLVDVQEIIEKHIKPSTTGIVAIGGNATVNTVINSMADENMTLGIIPVGKTNYLAHSLGINNWRMGAKLLVDPEKKPHRLGKIGKHYFVGSLEVLAHQNLLGKYLRGESLFKKFLGSSSRTQRNMSVRADIAIDEDLKISGPMQKLSVSLNDEKGGKKLRLILLTDSPKNVTKLWADELEIEGDKKMPVLMGNETVAHTPVEIKGCNKYIELLIPKTPAPKLTKSPKK